MSALDRTRPPEPGPIRDYDFPAVDRVEHANGITSLVCGAGDIPLVTAHVVVDAGAATEGDAQHGLSQLTINSLEGGTRTHSGESLAWALEELGLELSSWTTWDAAHVRVTATSDGIAAALRLLADIVRQPAFPPGEVERVRDEQLAEILQRAAEPRALADDMAARIIFSESTYGRSILGDAADVARLSHQDARAFHTARFCPDGISVLLVGDITPEAGHALVAEAFGDWSGTAEAPPPIRAGVTGEETTVHLVDRPGSVQSELRLGHVAVPRSHPAHFTLLVLNSLLGGAFMSRLNLNLREKHGFTYGVRSGFGFRRAAGPFIIQTAVATEVTARAVEECFRELHALLKDGPTEEEVANARDYIAGIFPLQLQSTEDLASRIAELVVYDLPIDSLEHYRAGILAVSRDEVEAAAQRFITPHCMAVVIAGDAAALRDDLARLGIGEVVVDDTMTETTA